MNHKYHVKEKWIKLIESCLSTKLSEWGYLDTENIEDKTNLNVIPI